MTVLNRMETNMEERRQVNHVDTNIKLARLEEKISHMEGTMRDVKEVLEKFMDQQKQHNDEKFGALEKRVDKIYTMGAIAVFIIGPLISLLGKSILAKFGF